MRYHPIKNIFTKDEWDNVTINIINPNYKERNIMIQLNKTMSENLFQIKMNNNYKLDLLFNDKIIYTDDYLYYYEITFDKNQENIELRDGMIYDC